jgi:opacity protein-like surface antigen
MRRTKLLATCAVALAAVASAAAAQESYTSETDGYSIELPSQTWKAVSRTDGVHEHTEFVNGDRSDG